MDNPSLRMMTRSTALEFDKSITWLRSNDGAINFADLVNSRLQHPVRPVASRDVEVFSDIDRTLRQRHGTVADGTWVPLQALARRNTRALNTTGGQSLVSAAVSSDAASSLLPESGILSAGARVLTGIKTSTMGLPFIDSVSGGANWHAEGVAPAAAMEPAFSLATLEPKSISVELIITRRLMQNTSVDLDELIRAELAQRFGAAIDAAALYGDGVLEPLGLLRHPDLDVLSLGADGAAMAHQDIAEMEARVLTRANGGIASPNWIVGPKLARKLRTTAKTAGSMIYEGSDLLGHRVIQSAATPENLAKGSATGCSAMIFGDMEELFVGFWGPAAIDLLIDGHTMAKDGKIRIVARAELGIVARRVGAFVAVKDALTT